MGNSTSTSVFIRTIDKIVHLDDNKCVVLHTGPASLFFDENPIEIKVGDNKVKATTLEFMKAFKDMLDTGVFELDQIDSTVWSIESELEEIRDQIDRFTNPNDWEERNEYL